MSFLSRRPVKKSHTAPPDPKPAMGGASGHAAFQFDGIAFQLTGSSLVLAAAPNISQVKWRLGQSKWRKPPGLGDQRPTVARVGFSLALSEVVLRKHVSTQHPNPLPFDLLRMSADFTVMFFGTQSHHTEKPLQPNIVDPMWPAQRLKNCIIRKMQ